MPGKLLLLRLFRSKKDVIEQHSRLFQNTNRRNIVVGERSTAKYVGQ